MTHALTCEVTGNQSKIHLVPRTLQPNLELSTNRRVVDSQELVKCE